MPNLKPIAIKATKILPPLPIPAPKPGLLSVEQRERLSLALVRDLDRAVFRQRWSGMECLDGEGEGQEQGLPDGLSLVWNNKLRNTAGRASWKK